MMTLPVCVHVKDMSITCYSQYSLEQWTAYFIKMGYIPTFEAMTHETANSL